MGKKKIPKLFKSIAFSSSQSAHESQIFTDFASLESFAWSSRVPHLSSARQEPWLADPHSMTAKLERVSASLQVKQLTSGWCSWADHCGEWAVRQVLLCHDDTPWLWGLTCIPVVSLMQHPLLLNLGNTPLGHIIFAEKSAEYRKFVYADLASSRSFCSMLPGWGCYERTPLWGRKSHLNYQGSQLMLTEVFLPEHPLYGV